MKKFSIIFLAVCGFIFTSISSCQTYQDVERDDVEQIEKVLKKPKFTWHINYFDACKKEDKCLYYVANPTPQKIELVNQDKAEIMADYRVELIRVKTVSEATLVIK